MASQFQMASQFPPVKLLAAATDAAGRTGAYASLRNALKAWVVAEVNQGAATSVTFSLLQSKDTSGTGSKAVSTGQYIWLDNATAASDALIQQSSAASFATDTTVANKLVLFEIVPESALDLANGYNHLSISTSASSASNITSATLYIYGSYQQAAVPTTVI